MTDRERKLLRRLASAKPPIRLSTSEDINDAQVLKDLGYLDVAIPPMSKGKHTYGEQDPAIVRQITPAGRKALEE